MFRYLLAFVCLVFAPVAGHAACARPSYDGAYLKAIPTSAMNQDLFSEALTREANFVRCKAGLKTLETVKPLTSLAAGHSGWMARATKLSHTSTQPGKQRFAPRMRSSGLRFSTAAENIAAFDRFQFPTGQFKISNASACRFAFQNGKPIPVHSYASLANSVVTGWMKSPGHKRNLMNRRMKLSGGGIGFDAKSPYCGRYYITQDYLG